MKTKRPLLITGLTLILISALGLGTLWWWNSRTVTAWVAIDEIARHAPVTADLFEAVELPAGVHLALWKTHTPPTGWATVRIPAGTLLHRGHLTTHAPDRRIIGETKLPIGMRGYALRLVTDLAPVLLPDDLVDVVLIRFPPETPTGAFSPTDPGEAVLLLQKVPFLQIQQEQEGLNVILALTIEQALTLEAYLNDNEALPLVLLSQDANPDLEPLKRYTLKEVDPGWFLPFGRVEE